MGIERVLVRCGTIQPRRSLRYQPCRVSWPRLGAVVHAGWFNDVIEAAEYAVLHGADSWKVTDQKNIVLGVHCDVAGILSAAIDEGLVVDVIEPAA